MGNGEDAGAGEFFNFSNPVLEVGSGSGFLNDITQVSAGQSHTCALQNNGDVVCWGAGSYGNLGNNATSTSVRPKKVVAGQSGSGLLKNIQQISAGGFHTCALKNDGSVFCWGYGADGQLGIGSTVSHTTPRKVKGVDGTGFLTDISQISVGSRHTCALKNNGRVLCWGYGYSGQIGNGQASLKKKTPVEVLEPVGNDGLLKNISQISLGGSTSCALRNDGQVLCWGRGNDGHLGSGATDDSNRPVVVVANGQSQNGNPLTNITQLSGGENHICALDSVNQVHCWGTGVAKRLGQIDDVTSESTPQRVKTDVANVYLSDVEQVGAGFAHSCALKTGGNLVCWGERGSGQLGDGKRDVTEDRGVPAPVASESDRPELPLQTISAGGLHSCQVSNQGSIKCWGRGYGGQLGRNEKVITNKGKTVPDSSGTGDLLDMAQVSSGENHSCALNSSGQVYCWGTGILGDNKDVRISPLPVLVNKVVGGGSIPEIAQISVGERHTCAVTVGKNVLCWGDNEYGQLGNGGYGDKLRPEYVKGPIGTAGNLLNIVQVSAGYNHTCAVNKSDHVFCWGSNAYLKLGMSSQNSTSTKPNRRDDISATQVSAGRDHTCALRTNSKVACWGVGSQGQAGRGSDNDSYTNLPTTIPDLDNVVQISAKSDHTCAVNTDGKVLCWGGNEYGRAGRPVSQSTVWVPRFVYGNNGTGNLANIIEVSAGWNHTCARKINGTSVCWGLGTDGQLGATNYANSANPVNVNLASGGVKKFTIKRRVSAGYKHTCAVKTSDESKVFCWGDASDGRLGINSSSGDKKRGLLVKGVGNSGNLKNIAQVTAGEQHTCALDKNNKVFCWGEGDNGRLGQSSNSNSLVPVEVPNGGFSGTPIQISAGAAHTCVVVDNGEVNCWGHSNKYQIGDSTSSTPVHVGAIILGGSGFTNNIQVSGGHEHTCSVKVDGSVWCWGGKNWGKLGNGENVNTTTYIPVRVKGVGGSGFLTGMIQVSAGDEHTCALHHSGTAYCWGSQEDGRLTQSGSGARNTPYLVKKSSSETQYGLVQVIAAWGHSCARTSNNKVICWGEGADGRLGYGGSSSQQYPKYVTTKDADDNTVDFTSVHELAQSKDNHVCVVQGTSYNVYCWGRGTNGRLGHGGTNNKVRPERATYSWGGTPADLRLGSSD